ncbi:dipeptidyl aminopeptidase/acylaminoacyl peptidase [Alteromonadaceae bacterium 2753L.S.0a.02]|nr:dipeptidyl aminopeptidase/acylaminoacyl peptidase [Alteromonadaceae bacterium 2753L.S.0a.02]
MDAKKLKIYFILVVLIISCQSYGAQLPVEAYAALPDVRSVIMSPDGKHLSSLVRIDLPDVKGTAVNIYALDSGKSSYPLLAKNETYSINWTTWANDEILLVSTSKPDSINLGIQHAVNVSKLLAVNITTGEVSNVLPTKLIRLMKKRRWFVLGQDDVIDLLPDDKNNILMEVAGSYYRVNIYNHTTKKIREPKKKLPGWETDQQGRLRIGYDWDDDKKWQHIYLCDINQKCKEKWNFGTDDINTVWPIGFDADPNILYYRAYHEGLFAVFKLDLRDDNKPGELVYSDPNYDVFGRLLYSKNNHKVVGITDGRDTPYTFWDDEYIALQKAINRQLPDTENYIYSFSDDETRYIVLATSDKESGVYYLGNRVDKSLKKIAYRYKHLTPDVLAVRQRIEYKSRDGLQIEAYLTLPKDKQAKKLPTLIIPHGGPQSRETDGFDLWSQFFANRGYAVLQMNFRGSTGKGLEFKKAGLKEWGRAMQDDIQDGAIALIEKGISDKDRICILGGSYGGYAALMGAVKTPDFYKCVVSFAGVTDMQKLASRSEYWRERVVSDEESVRAISPLHQYKKIKVPVLLVHGDEDRVVPVFHSRKMFKKLQSNNANVSYIELPGETHHLRNSENRIQTFKAFEKFLDEHLSVATPKESI